MKKKKAAKISDLKKGIEKIDKTQLATKERELKPATAATLKGIRTLFYIFLIFIIALGVWQLIRSKQPRIIENIIRYEYSESESDKAKAFAESFVKVYLTYGDATNSSNHKAKLDQYLNGVVAIGRPDHSNGSSDVLDTMVYSVDKIDDKTSNIVVKATVELTNKNKMVEKYDPTTGEKTLIPTVEEKDVYVSVPILAEGGKVIVNDYPTFLKVTDKLDAKFETYVGEKLAMDTEVNAINKTLTDFFGIYYGGTPGQIKAFFKDEQNVAGLGGAFKFNSIKALEAYIDGDVYTAIATIEITESDLGGVFNQRHLLTLEKKDDRYVIISIKNRGK